MSLLLLLKHKGRSTLLPPVPGQIDGPWLVSLYKDYLYKKAKEKETKSRLKVVAKETQYSSSLKEKAKEARKVRRKLGQIEERTFELISFGIKELERLELEKERLKLESDYNFLVAQILSMQEEEDFLLAILFLEDI